MVSPSGTMFSVVLPWHPVNNSNAAPIEIDAAKLRNLAENRMLNLSVTLTACLINL